MSNGNLITQLRAIALVARQITPTAVTVHLEASDQADNLTESCPFVTDADGNEFDAPDEYTDELWDRTCDISSDDANNGVAPGWKVLNKHGGYYELDVAAILAEKPEYKDSLLAETFGHFEYLISVIPSEPPIIMAEVDDVSYRATFTPEAWIKGQAVAVDPEGETTWTVSDQNHERAKVGIAGNERLKDDPGAPAWVHRWTGPFRIEVERIGTPRILSMTAHCPRCGSTELAEMDWDTRWNRLSEPEFGQDGRSGDLFLGVGEGDSEHNTLVDCFCQTCGQVIDLKALDIETSW